MPRARNIKPSLFENEILGQADPLLTILFMSLWCIADREGRLEDRPERIKAQTFPYRIDVQIERSLNELQRSGFIKRYKIEESRYIEVINFKKHQRPHHTEKESVLPPCDSKALIVKPNEFLNGNSRLNNGELTVVERSDLLIPDTGYLIPDTGYLIQKHTAKPGNQKIIDCDFEDAWKAYPKRPGANKTQAQKAWNARLKEGVEVKEMQEGVFKYRQYCERMQVEPQYVKQAATFFGPDKHFLNDWAAGASKADKFDSWLNGTGDADVIDI